MARRALHRVVLAVAPVLRRLDAVAGALERATTRLSDAVSRAWAPVRRAVHRLARTEVPVEPRGADGR